jgi:arginyl-tRNA synthetase
VTEIEAMSGAGALPPGLDLGGVTVEPPRNPSHGDIAINVALVLAKQARAKPRDLAAALAERLGGLDDVAAVEVAGPGFINLRLDDSFWRDQLAEILRAGTAYGDSDIGGSAAVNVEFVSANPTGPLHIGHGRGAVVGDVLASLLEKAGYKVTREYYVNDAGAQIEALARSVYFHYRQALGRESGAMPEGLYPGDYLVSVGQNLAERDGDKWLSASEPDWLDACANVGRDVMMGLIRRDLADLGIRHDVIFSERTLHERGQTEETLDDLKARGLVYEGVLEPPRGKSSEDWKARAQTLFKATEFGDDVDRPLKKSDGEWTYFAADIAYHRDKFDRGFNTMIDVWGADHGGYVKRMTAAVKAVSDGKAELDVKLCQLVNLLKDGVPVKMSKRAGDFVTLREVINEVGRDVVRFMMLTRRNDAPLDFDFAKVTEQSRDNPVFYVQYAHARGRSALRHAAAALPGADLGATALAGSGLDRLTEPDELALIRALSHWPHVVESAALSHEPHRLTYYLHDVAAAFHGLWNRGTNDVSLRFVVAEDAPLSLARLALVQGVLTVIASGLAIIGVEPVEELR